MLFTERHHAFLSATFYRLMKEESLHDFRAVFRMATQIYAQQRGSRMAQRALRDGQALDFATYRAYKEWAATDACTAELQTHAEVTAEGDDLRILAYGCPWSAQYHDLDLQEGGHDYCDDLDVSIARGFNPDLKYEVLQTAYFGQTACLHYQRQARLDRQVPAPSDNVRPFEFHCAHLYHTFARLMTAIYKADGTRLSAQVLDAFAAAYGQAYADKLGEYRDVDFNFIN